MSKPFSVDEAEFQIKVLASEKPVLVDFWAVWCGPCKMIAPILEELAEEMEDKISIAKVNVDENNDLASQYGIRNIPTLLLFKGGKLVDSFVGLKPKTELVNLITPHL